MFRHMASFPQMEICTSEHSCLIACLFDLSCCVLRWSVLVWFGLDFRLLVRVVVRLLLCLCYVLCLSVSMCVCVCDCLCARVFVCLPVRRGGGK